MMLSILRWIEDTDGRTVGLISFISFLTILLVFVGTVNDAVESRMIAKSLLSSVESQRLSVPSHTTSSTDQRQKTSKAMLRSVPNATEEHNGISLLLDLSKNLLLVKRGQDVVYSALAATGSGKMLRDPYDPSRTWKFETPRGSFRIENKLEKPVWIRPDWAFIEKGLPVPKDAHRRLLPNVLGDYALGFGNGYFIHGAIYTYLLGFNVTHGCIQLNEEDLRYMYETIPVGAKLEIV